MAKSGVIIIGTEITQGFSIDTNSDFLAGELKLNGFDCYSILKVPDDIDTVSNAIKYLSGHCQVLILTGGLGSTHDDITREALSKTSGRKLELRSDLKAKIERLMPKDASREMFFRQAYLPNQARSIPSEQGTAPGIILNEGDCTIIALPGVPREMKSMLKIVLPELQSRFPDSSPLLHEKIKIFGAAEPQVAMTIDPIIKEYGELNFTILAGIEEIKLILTAFAKKDSKEGLNLADAVKRVADELGDIVFGFGEVSLEEVVGNELARQNLHLAVAESCTGGMLAEKITAVPGSSEYFSGGIVSYGNEMKQDVLDVPEETFRDFGAVSRECAIQMAEGAKKAAAADIAVSITGIAGPGGGTAEKPVGLVFIAITDNNKLRCRRYVFTGDRDIIRRKAAQTGLNMIRLFLLDKLTDE